MQYQKIKLIPMCRKTTKLYDQLFTSCIVSTNVWLCKTSFSCRAQFKENAKVTEANNSYCYLFSGFKCSMIIAKLLLVYFEYHVQS